MVSYFHESSQKFGYFTFKKDLIGRIGRNKNENKDENEEPTFENLIINIKEKKVYIINTTTDGKEKSEIYELKDLNSENFDDKLRNKIDKFIDYHNLVVKNKKDLPFEEIKLEVPEEEEKEKKDETGEKGEISEKTTEEKEIDNKNNETTKENTQDKTLPVYIKSWNSQKYAHFLVLSNDIKQTIFKDKVSVLISDSEEKMGYYQSDQEGPNKYSIVKLKDIFTNTNADLVKRLNISDMFYLKN